MPRRTTPLVRIQKTAPGDDLLHLLRAQAGAFAATVRHRTVALGAVLIKQVCPCSYGLGIVFQRVAPGNRFPRSLRQLEKLKRQVEQDCRFRVLISRLEIGGYCAACRGTK